MADQIKVPCAECGRAIELQKRSLTRYYKRNNTDQYVCASCTASRIGKRPVSDQERQKRSATATALWKDENYRKRVMLAHQKVTSQTKFKKNVSENNRKRWANLERKKIDNNTTEDSQYKKNILHSKFKKSDLETDGPDKGGGN